MNAEVKQVTVIDHDTQQPVEAKTTTALALVTKSIAEINAVESTIAGLETKYRGVVFQVQTSDGMKEACKARAEIRAPRYQLQNMQKAAKAPLNELKRSIDEQTEDFIERIEAIEDPIHLQISTEEKRKEDEKKAREEAERKRVAAIQERIEQIRDRVGQAVGEPAAAIQARIQALVALQIDDTFAELKKQAEGARETTLIRLRAAEAKQIALEEEQERIRQERARLAAEEARQAAERKRIAEDEARARAAREEQERLARAAREEEETRARKAREAEERRIAAEREHLAELQRQAEATRRAEDRRLAAWRAEQEDLIAEQRAAAAREEEERRAAIAAEEQRLADERARLQREQEELQRVREAGTGAPGGATASEGDDSNSAKAPTEPAMESRASSISGPETTSSQGNYIFVVFDGPPSHESGRFVEVENEAGKSIAIGEWIERPDKLWALRIEMPNTEHLKDVLRQAHSYVYETDPRDLNEGERREQLLALIDAVAPPPPPAPSIACDKDPVCILAKGHDGDCDDSIPF